MLKKAIQGFNHYLFYLAGIPLFAMMVVTVIDVTGRYFRAPLPGALELNQIFLAVLCVLCWAHTQAKKGHITIDLLYNALPQRVQNAVSVFSAIVGLTVAGLIAWTSIPVIMTARRIKEWTDILQVPIWPFKAMLFVGAVLLGLQFLTDIVDNARALCRKQPVAAKAVETGVPGPGGTGIDG